MAAHVPSAVWAFGADDDMEGTLTHLTQSKIATLQNSASEDHVNESQLQLGLFAYPVLQAADILMYQYVNFSYF